VTTGEAAPPTYDERLAVPWWWWPVGLAVAVLGAAEIHGGVGGPVRSVLPYIALPLLVVLGLLGLSRARVRVADGLLHVPGARVPVALLGAVEPGRRDSYVALRPWLVLAVRADLDDPEDDTVFWLIGTRRPAELARALAAAQQVGRRARP